MANDRNEIFGVRTRTRSYILRAATAAAATLTLVGVGYRVGEYFEFGGWFNLIFVGVSSTIFVSLMVPTSGRYSDDLVDLETRQRELEEQEQEYEKAKDEKRRRETQQLLADVKRTRAQIEPASRFEKEQIRTARRALWFFIVGVLVVGVVTGYLIYLEAARVSRTGEAQAIPPLSTGDAIARVAIVGAAFYLGGQMFKRSAALHLVGQSYQRAAIAMAVAEPLAQSVTGDTPDLDQKRMEFRFTVYKSHLIASSSEEVDDSDDFAEAVDLVNKIRGG